MAVPFYNQVDQDIYAGGDHFIPQQDYRLNYTPSQRLASTIGNTGGVTGTQAAYPYIWPPQGGGGNSGLHNVYGYDPNISKTFSKDVWTGEVGGPGNKYGGWKTQDVTGYLSPSGWKTAKGKNINHAGLEVPTLMGSIINKLSGIKTGEKQIGDIKGTFTKDALEEEEEGIAAAAAQRNILNKLRAQAYKGPINVGGGGQDIGTPIDTVTTADINTLGPNNPLIGRIDHTGGGDHGSITRDPGSRVEGAPTHSTRDDLMAQGGRIGYKKRGFVDPEEVDDLNIFEFMQDQGVNYDQMAEGVQQEFPSDALGAINLNEEQMAMISDLNDKGMDISLISTISGAAEDAVKRFIGLLNAKAQGGSVGYFEGGLAGLL